MNSLQKKSLIVSLSLGAIYSVLAFYPSSFLFALLATLFFILAFSMFYFDIKFSKEDILEKAKFLTLPILLNFGSIVFVSGVFQRPLKIFLTLLITAVNFYLFVALKRVQNLEERAAITYRNLLISASFFSVFLSLSAIFRSYVLLSTSRYSKLSLIVLVLLVGVIFYLVSSFLAWENGIETKKLRIYNIVGTLLAMEAALFGSVWIINYPVFSLEEKASLGGFPIPAIVLTIIFYFIWGVMSHKVDKSLTRRVLMEYVVISITFLLVLFVTAKWLPLT